VVGPSSHSHRDDGKMFCHSYNFFAFPYVSPDTGHDPVFTCQGSALRFNAQHRMNFNTWISEGIPYMTREEESQLKSKGLSQEEVNQKVGVLRMWTLLCSSRLPFVVHCPLDLFFLLYAFERRPLPRYDPVALAILIRQCTPKVYDTAHLHGAIGRFRCLGLSKFYQDAKAQHEELRKTGRGDVVAIEFELQGDTAARYSIHPEAMAHEAGYDSLMTAQLFGYLRAMSPGRIREAANRLFLYRSIEYVDIERAALDGVAGSPIFDLSRVTLLVAALDPNDALANEAARCIAATGSEYKWMDASHILIVLRASGGAAIRKARDLAAQVHGVESWLPFEQWREIQALETQALRAKRDSQLRMHSEAARPDVFRPPPAMRAADNTDGADAGLASSGSASGGEQAGSTLRTSWGASSANHHSNGKTNGINGVDFLLENQRRHIWFLQLYSLGLSGVLAYLAVRSLRRA